MSKRFIWFLSFGFVFILGFAAGVLWRSSIETSSETVALPAAEVVAILDDEAQIAKALEDPDFKRIHDYLNRVHPLQLEIPMRAKPPQEQIPMSERPPVRFTVEP